MKTPQLLIVQQYRALHFEAVAFVNNLDTFLHQSESNNLPLELISQVSRLADSVNDFTKFTGSYDLSNIGGACRHSAHIPEAPGQDGTYFDIPLIGSDAVPMVEYYKDQLVTYGLSSDAAAQGGNQ